MEIIYRKNLNRNLTSEEVDGNFELLFDAFNSVVDGTGKAFASRVLAMSVNPLPADDTPFVVYGETGHIGQYRYASGEVDGYVLIQPFFKILTTFNKTNNIDGATMKSIDDYFQLKITENSDTILKGWFFSEVYTASNEVYDSDFNLLSADIVWADGDISTIDNVTTNSFGTTSMRYNRSDGSYATRTTTYDVNGFVDSETITLTGF